jgi:2-methylcitrate dehydratase PrpD
MALALRFRAVKLPHFADEVRRDPALARLAARLHVTAPLEIDKLYPRLRPARVTLTTRRGVFTRQADEALGSRLVPLDDDGLMAKFREMATPVLPRERVETLLECVWALDTAAEMRPIVKLMGRRSA